jgi:hypothetical protein
MQHSDAAPYLVERYLLDELSPLDRDAFEEHFFGCPDCAEELRLTAAFLSAAKSELRPGAELPRVSNALPKPGRRAWFEFLWRPAFLSPVAALLLMVVVYQNVVVYPQSRTEIARLSRPETLTTVSLIGDGSRGGTTPSATVSPGAAVLLTFDVPAAERYASYAAELQNPAGTTLWSVPVSADQARDTVAVRIPAGRWEPGNYTLVIQGYASPGVPATLLTRYKFSIHRPD